MGTAQVKLGLGRCEKAEGAMSVYRQDTVFGHPSTGDQPSSAKRQITIWEALKAKLGRDPTRAELRADWERILRNE